MQAELLKQHLQDALPGYLNLLKSWVQINSHTGNARGVNELGQQTAAAFGKLGFTAEYVQAEEPECGQHLYLHRSGQSEKTLVFVSHLDTVYTKAEEEENQFAYREEPTEGHIYGPGVGDIKGGTLMILMVLEALAAFDPSGLDSINLLVALNAGEERLISSFSKHLRTRMDPKTTIAVLVFEGGSPIEDEWPLVIARKGRFDFTIRVQGKSAHSGINFWKGESAIVTAAEIVQQLHALSDQAKDISVNVGRLNGGTEINRVPDLAVMEGEVRMHLNGLAACQTQIEEIIAPYESSVKLEIPLSLSAWEENEHTNRLCEIWKAAGATLGMNVTGRSRGGLSDGNYFWNEFATIDGLGPTGTNFHCSKLSPETDQIPEYIERASIVPKAMLNCLAISKLIHDQG